MGMLQLGRAVLRSDWLHSTVHPDVFCFFSFPREDLNLVTSLEIWHWNAENRKFKSGKEPFWVGYTFKTAKSYMAAILLAHSSQLRASLFTASFSVLAYSWWNLVFKSFFFFPVAAKNLGRWVKSLEHKQDVVLFGSMSTSYVKKKSRKENYNLIKDPHFVLFIWKYMVLILLNLMIPLMAR